MPAKAAAAEPPRGDAPPATGTPVPAGHFPGLDILRGIAVLAVVLYHGFYLLPGATPWGPVCRFIGFFVEQGYLGVDLFFVLSGFLITGILLRSQTSDIYYSDFYWRRALRILPVYLAVLFVLIAFRLIDFPFAIASLLYLSNVSQIFHAERGYLVFWSLAVEEQFYLFWPFLMRRFSARQAAWFCALLCLAEPFVRWWIILHHRSVNPFHTQYLLDCFAYGGLIAALRATGWLTRGRMTALGAASLSAGILAVAAAANWPQTAFALSTRSVPLGWLWLFTGLLLFALRRGSKPFATGNPLTAVLQFLAYISYGLYLIHQLCFMLFDYLFKGTCLADVPTNGLLCLVARTFFGSALAIASAYVSRRFLEEPFLRLKDRLWSLRGLRFAARERRVN